MSVDKYQGQKFGEKISRQSVLEFDPFSVVKNFHMEKEKMRGHFSTRQHTIVVDQIVRQ